MPPELQNPCPNEDPDDFRNCPPIDEQEEENLRLARAEARLAKRGNHNPTNEEVYREAEKEQ